MTLVRSTVPSEGPPEPPTYTDAELIARSGDAPESFAALFDRHAAALIFDPGSGEVIGEREVALKSGYIPGVRAGTTIEYTSVSRQIVNAMGTVPGR